MNTEQSLYQSGIKHIAPWVKRYSRLTLVGEQNLPKPGEGALFACNHSGSLWWDALTFVSALSDRRIQFIAHHWDASIPLIKAALDLLDCSYLDKSEALINEHSDVVQRLKQGDQMCIYPEESYHSFRHRYTLFNFSTHVVRYAELAKVPIIPVGIIGAEEAAPTFFGFKKSSVPLHIPFHIPIVMPVNITVDIGEPVFFSDLIAETESKDYEALADKVRNRLFHRMKCYRSCRLSDEAYIEKQSWF